MYVKTKFIGMKINNELQFCYFNVFSVFEITYQDAQSPIHSAAFIFHVDFYRHVVLLILFFYVHS